MGAIIQKEFKSYFLTPVGYVFIGLFLLGFSLFFLVEIFYQSINFEYIFYSGASLLTFTVPLITMRTFSEERKSGTEQLILTAPVSITKVVLAKFIAATLVVIVSELCTFMYFIILTFFVTPNISTTLVTLFGFTLLAMSYISFGILASSITENQIIAGVITIITFILMMYLPGINESLANFSLINVFSKYITGQIDIADTITLVTFTITSILITIILMQRRKSARR